MKNVFETTAGKKKKKQLCLLPSRWCFSFCTFETNVAKLSERSNPLTTWEKRRVGLETNDTHCWIKLSHKCCLFILESRTITFLRSDTRMLDTALRLFTPVIGLHFEKAQGTSILFFFAPFLSFLGRFIQSLLHPMTQTLLKKSITLSKSSFQSGCHKSPVLCPGSSYREFYCRPWCCHWIDWGWCGATVEISSP